MWLLGLDADFAAAMQNDAYLGSTLGVGDERIRRGTGDAVTARGSVRDSASRRNTRSTRENTYAMSTQQAISCSSLPWCVQELR
jgi:hypothetical protein